MKVKAPVRIGIYLRANPRYAAMNKASIVAL